MMKSGMKGQWGRDRDGKLAFNIGKYIRKWGVEFLLQEIVDYLEGMDGSDRKLMQLREDLVAALARYKQK